MTFGSCPTLTRLGAIALAACLSAPAAAASNDEPLAAAQEYVKKSKRYLHHTKLRRGMKGYGLTVFAETKVARFNVEVVSVVDQWGPHRSVILAMISGQGLEVSGVVAGMSGSPIFMRDTDGKDKIIGALAYGWSSQKRALCGIQPITQMLAVGGMLDALRNPDKAEIKKTASHSHRAVPGETRLTRDQVVRAAMDPRNRDFSMMWLRGRSPDLPPAPAPAATGGLVPLPMPMTVSGVHEATLERLKRDLAPLGIVPMAGGSSTDAQRKAAASAKLVPGAAVAIPMVTGDADYSGVGTVTDVVGKQVMAFGHGMYSDGDVALPMGPAYVHTIVASLSRSFKVSSGLKVTGTLTRDEAAGVGGVIGPKVVMFPMTITMEWKGKKRRRVYRFNVARHRRMTPRLVRSLLYDAAWGWRELPREHTVHHAIEIEFEGLGKYRASNVSSGGDVYAASSDLTRPVSMLMDNTLGPPAKIKRIDVRIGIETGERYARIVRLDLDGATYQPGETIAGTVTLQARRKPRQTARMKMVLPGNLPQGRYTLTVCDATNAILRLQREMPQRFAPRTVPQLFESIRRVVDRNAAHLYMRIPIARGGGLALETKELPDLPPSKAGIIAQATPMDARRYSAALVGAVATPHVLSGSASAPFTVRRRPQQTLLRNQSQ